MTRGIVSLPTGTGKTPLAAMLIREFDERTLFLAHREELLTQAFDKIRMVIPGADVGILRAEESGGLDCGICVASVQTAIKPRRLEELKARGYSFCVIDEAHHAIKNSAYWKIIHELGFMKSDPGKFLTGLTATAFRTDKAALGEVFEAVIFERGILPMMKAGYLCDARGIAVKTDADLSGVRSRAGDLAVEELSLAVDTPERNRLIAKSYIEHAKGRRAVTFTVNV